MDTPEGACGSDVEKEGRDMRVEPTLTECTSCAKPFWVLSVGVVTQASREPCQVGSAPGFPGFGSESLGKITQPRSSRAGTPEKALDGSQAPTYCLSEWILR